MVKIAPSILTAPFGRLERQIAWLEKGGADWVHLDIMDGHFVPNISFGPPVVKSIRGLTRLPFDTHLMISDPDRYIDAFRAAGSDRLTVHVETCPHLHRTVQRIRQAGMKPGVTLNPATPAGAIREIIPFVDLVLVMTVNPGFGGQKFIRPMLAKIEKIAGMIADSGRPIELEADGGIDRSNAADLVAAGVSVLVAGNAIFSHKDIPRAIRDLRRSALL